MEWFLEPGHTAASFAVRHMMVTLVRGHFKDVHGSVQFDPARPETLAFQAQIDASGIWSGESDRDAHLRNADFLDVENHAKILFQSTESEVLGDRDFCVHGDLTIRGVTKNVKLMVRFLGQWETPWWQDGEDKGPKTRAGFVAKTTIDRMDFGVSWNAALESGGFVVGRTVDIVIDAEAILSE